MNHEASPSGAFQRTCGSAAATYTALLLSLSALLDRILIRASQPVSGGSAAAFRILFGLLGLVAVIRIAARGWISELYVEPVYHFTYWGFGWVQPWPSWGMYLHFALLGLASVGVAVGYRYRLSIIAFFLLFTYVELIDRTTYLNHYYWVTLASFLMIFMPLNRVASIDAWRNPSMKSGSVPQWALWILMAQLAAVYLFAGVAKLNPDWLFSAQPMRIWMFNNGDVPLIGPLLKEVWVAYAMSWAGAIFDLTIIGWLLWRRSRIYAYVVLVVFHLLTWVLFPIGMFPWIMIAGALIFFGPDWPQRLFASLTKRHRAAPDPPGLESRRPSRIVKIGALALVAFALIQIIIPLRHWAYPGNVRWNEDGYLFSWRVLLTEKTGHIRFDVADTATGQQWVEYPEDWLSPLQVERMPYQPDMILQTAHFIPDEAANQGLEVEVRADSFVAYNGREAARFIDPHIDLARVEQGLWPKTWVLSAPDDA